MLNNINEDIEEMAVQEHMPDKKAVYVLVNETGSFDAVSGEKFAEEEENRKKDYYSTLININKSVDKYKKIQSSNEYTLFTKVLPELTDKMIENYYKTLKCSEEEAAKYIKWICANREQLVTMYPGKYIKIFFPASMEKYKEKGKEYLYNSIFNDVRNVVVTENGETLGLPITININYKKPFLMNRTRKLPYPYVTTKEECYSIKCLLDVFKSAIQKGFDKAYLSNDTKQITFVKYGQLLNKDINGELFQFELNNRGTVVIKNMATVCFSSKFLHNDNVKYYYSINELFFDGELYKMLVQPEERRAIKDLKEKKMILDILRMWFLEGNPPIATRHTLIKGLIQIVKNNLGKDYDKDIQRILFIKKIDV